MGEGEGDMKEMVGGCCVCSDESGWDENPLVYCDGDGCNVAVHQACYGIVSVPPGPWFCRKCESQERAARVRCELCPSKGGALKRTDTSGWAHVVCALYIPEVRFGDVATMEPILVSIVPPDRFSKSCYLCELNGRASKAQFGACMSCNKPGCRMSFHVTCAQGHGLLCEEQVQSMNNVTYCGYCQHHYAKLKRGHNVKPIPAFKSTHDATSTEQSSGKSAPPPLPPPPSADPARSERRKRPKASRSPRASATALPAPPSSVNESSSSSMASDAPAMDERRERTERSDRGERNERTERVEVERGERMERMERSDKMDRTERAERIERSERSEKTERTDRPDRPERTERSDRPERTERSERSERSDRPDRQDRPERTDRPDRTERLERPSAIATTAVVSSSAAAAAASAVEQQSGNQTPTDSSDTKFTTANFTETVVTPSGSVFGAPPSRPAGAEVTGAGGAGTESESTLSTASDLEFKDGGVVVKQEPRDPDPPVVTQSAPFPAPVPSSAPVPSVPLVPVPSVPSVPAPSSVPPTPVPPVTQPPTARPAPPSQPSQPSQGVIQTAPALSSTGGPPQQLQQPVSVSLPVVSLSQISPQQVASKSKRSHPATTTDKEPRKRKPPGRPRKHAAPPPLPLSPGIAPPPGREAATPDSAAGTEGSPGSAPPPPPLPPPPAARGRVGVEYGAPLSVNGRSSGGGVLPSRTNGLPAAAHMLGNQLNPASLMAPKLSDSLAAELAEQAGYLEPQGRLVGPPLPGRAVSGGAVGTVRQASGSAAPPFPQSLSELLERQWEQGSHFLMEQSQHFDVAALLSCLYQLRQENEQLEEHMSELSQRRDHLLAVNARLSQPLETAPPPLPASARGPPAAARIHYGAGGPLAHHTPSPRPPLENGVTDPAAASRPAPPSPLQLHSPLGGGGRLGGSRQPPPASPLGGSRRSPTVRPGSSAPYTLPGACSSSDHRSSASVSSSSLQPLSGPSGGLSGPAGGLSGPAGGLSGPAGGLSGPLQVNTALTGRPPHAHQTAAVADHRIIESLRVSAATGVSGGYPQYQLVSPPGPGPTGPPLHHVVHMPPPGPPQPSRARGADKR